MAIEYEIKFDNNSVASVNSMKYQNRISPRFADIISYLLHQQPHVSATSANHTGRTCLHLAAAGGSVNVCRLLVEEAGADVNAIMSVKVRRDY